MFDTVIALNQPVTDNLKSCKPGGLLIHEASKYLKPPTRTDVEVVPIEAAIEANKTQ